MSAVEIVPYRSCHFDGVDRLWRQAFPHDAPRNRAAAAIPLKLAVQSDLFLVALENGEVTGSIMAGFDGYRGWLNRVAVFQTHRGKGIGEALVREAERRLLAMGCQKINLQILGGNDAVAGFYRRLGYEVEDRISMGKSFPLDLAKRS